MNDGTVNASPYIQLALDSDFAVFFPPGTYRLDDPLTIDKPKLIECFGGSMPTGYIELGDSTSINPESTYEQVRLVWNGDASENVITYNISKIFWHGGCFDVQGVSGYNGSVFDLPCRWISQVGGRQDGYGCGVQGATFIGNSNEVRSGVAHPKGIVMRLQGADLTRTWAYIYHGIFDNYFVGMGHACQHTARNESINLTSNSHEWQIRCRDTKVALEDEGGQDTWYRIWHEGGPIFSTQNEADTTASIRITLDLFRLDLSMFEKFDQGGSGSEWYNSKTYDISGAGSIVRPHADAIDRAIRIDEQLVQNEYNLQRFGETGGLAGFGATEADFLSSTSAVNTSIGKRDGTLGFVSDFVTNGTGIPYVVATGGNAGDPWRSIADGAIVYDP